MTNIRLHYLHRDEGNWKEYLDVVLSNQQNISLDEIERRIRGRLVDGDHFYPELSGLPESACAQEGDWHEFDRVELANDEAKALLSVNELLQRLRRTQPKPIKIHKVPKVIPLRLAISWLEFLRETRKALDIVLSAISKDSVVIVWRNEDWDLLGETLEMDVNSSHIERSLRKEIAGALDRGKQIPDFCSSMKLILRKSLKIEKRFQRVVKRHHE